MKRIISTILYFVALKVSAQFSPPAGQAGTNAMYKDSSAFVNWASSCSVVRGFIDISVPDSGYASVGDSTMAIGASGTNGVVSLGDGGYAIVQFPFPIKDGPGNDFAVFENSFSDDYLEMAFVEVSSDGINYFRFPAVSNTQDTIQCGPFGLTDASKLNNLAGKFRMYYGTPFDLSELSGISGLDLNHISHVKIIDLIGSIDALYATTDIYGHKVNDPWPTPYPSSGFDLEAVGVIHQNTSVGTDESSVLSNSFTVFQNVDGSLNIALKSSKSGKFNFCLNDLTGKTVFKTEFSIGLNEKIFTVKLPEQFASGLYICSIVQENGLVSTNKIYLK